MVDDGGTAEQTAGRPGQHIPQWTADQIIDQHQVPGGLGHAPQQP